MDKQLTQYLLRLRYKWRMLPNYCNFPNRNVQTFGFVYHDTNGLNHGQVWKTQSFLLSEICTVILWQDCYGKGILRKSYCSTVGRRFSNWECLFVHREKGFSLSVYVDDIKIVWKETKHWSDVESTQQRSWFGKTNIFPWSCTSGMYSKTMWNKQRYCGQPQNYVRIANFRGENWKNFHTQRTFVFLHGPMIRKFMRRNALSDIVC